MYIWKKNIYVVHMLYLTIFSYPCRNGKNCKQKHWHTMWISVIKDWYKGILCRNMQFHHVWQRNMLHWQIQKTKLFVRSFYNHTFVNDYNMLHVKVVLRFPISQRKLQREFKLKKKKAYDVFIVIYRKVSTVLIFLIYFLITGISLYLN